MTSKDYQLIADAINKARMRTDSKTKYAIDKVINELCYSFLADNSDFDNVKFITACEDNQSC